MDIVKKYFWKYRYRLAVGFAFVILTNITSLMGPWILKYAVDSLRAGVVLEKLLLFSGLILGVAVVQGTFRFFMRRIMIGLSREIEYFLRLDIFDKLQQLPLEFFQINPTGDIISRATSDLSNVRLFLGPGIMNFFNTLVLLGLAMVFMFSISPKLMIFSILPLPFASMVMMRFSSLFYRRYRRSQEAYGRMNSRAQENFTGIRVVKAYAQEDAQTELYRHQNEQYLSENLKLASLRGFFHPVSGFIIGLSTIIVLWFGGRMIIGGEITLGDLVAFLGFMYLLVWPTIALGWVVNLLQRGLASAERIKRILKTEPSIADMDNPVSPERIAGDINISDLSFSYPDGKNDVLKNINLDIKAGQKVAIVGRTASGKTTLISLIPRLYGIDRGQISIDGLDINSMALKSLREAIGFVPQETFLFSDTLERNIALGNHSGDDFSINQAVRMAGMDPDLESFPEGLETIIGERGITLSGGQKQRTALARAVIRDPKILILDDVFSSVDAETEQVILDNLSSFMKGKTTIIITHRLSSITDADQIIVLEKGRIAERGTHKELLHKEGLYAEMFHRQRIIDELEREGSL